MVSAWKSAEPAMPPNKPRNAPVPVVRFQNMPSRNVAKIGAFTKPNTSWMMSMALSYCLAKYAAPMLKIMPTTVMTLPVRK